MGRSVPWNETVALGQKIVREWDGRPSLLVRWMSHRIAELMEKADKAESKVEREARREKCTDLILRLWERRKHWPYGSPLARVNEALSAIAGEPEFGDPSEPDQPDPSGRWEKVLQEVDRLQRKETSVLLFAIVANMELVFGEEWDEDYGGLMDERERETVDTLIALRNEASGENFELGFIEAPHFSKLPDEERAKLVRSSLRDIAERRAELLQNIDEDTN